MRLIHNCWTVAIFSAFLPFRIWNTLLQSSELIVIILMGNYWIFSVHLLQVFPFSPAHSTSLSWPRGTTKKGTNVSWRSKPSVQYDEPSIVFSPWIFHGRKHFKVQNFFSDNLCVIYVSSNIAVAELKVGSAL